MSRKHILLKEPKIRKVDKTNLNFIELYRRLGESETTSTEVSGVLSYPLENSYVDSATMFGDQGNQTIDYFQYVIDIDTYYQYLGTTNGDISDYRELTADETTIITGKNTRPIDKDYVDAATMYLTANQRKQKAGWIYRVNSDNSFYEYLGTRNGDATDYIQIGGGAGGGGETIFKVTASFSAAQLKNLDSSPIEVIPTPGPGKYIEVLRAVGHWKGGSVPFDNGNALGLLNTGTFIFQFVQLDCMRYTSTFRFIIPVYITGTPNNSINPDKGISLSSSFNNTATGDSTMDLYITYTITDIL